MEAKELKVIFGKLAKSYGFEQAFGRWYKESRECIAILELQKSNYGNYFQLLIKVFIKGLFGHDYEPNKELMMSSIGHINSGEPKKYKTVLDLDRVFSEQDRIASLAELFENHIVPFTNKALSRAGIWELAEKEDVFITPAMRNELNFDQ